MNVFGLFLLQHNQIYLHIWRQIIKRHISIAYPAPSRVALLNETRRSVPAGPSIILCCLWGTLLLYPVSLRERFHSLWNFWVFRVWASPSRDFYVDFYAIFQRVNDTLASPASADDVATRPRLYVANTAGKKVWSTGILSLEQAAATRN